MPFFDGRVKQIKDKGVNITENKRRCQVMLLCLSIRLDMCEIKVLFTL